jgi:HEAT repeat protein
VCGVKDAVSLAISVLGTPEARDLLIGFATDGDEIIRAVGADLAALEMQSDAAAATQVLLLLARDDSPTVRRVARGHLFSAGTGHYGLSFT